MRVHVRAKNSQEALEVALKTHKVEGRYVRVCGVDNGLRVTGQLPCWVVMTKDDRQSIR